MSQSHLKASRISLHTGDCYPGDRGATATESAPLIDQEGDRSLSDVQFFADAKSGAAGGIVIGLPSYACFAVNFPKRHWKQKPRPDSLAYELEPVVPLDADTMLVDAISTPVGWLAIAADSGPLQESLVGVRQRATWIAAACPVVILAASKLIRGLPKRGNAVVVWQTNHTLDWLEISNRNIYQWVWVSATEDSIRKATAASRDGAGSEHFILVNTEEWIHALVRTHCDTVDLLQLDVQHEAQATANRIVHGFDRPLFNLYSGVLAEADAIKPFRWTLIATLASLSLLLMVMGGVFLWRANENEKEVVRLQDRQAAIFSELFPGQPVPIGLLTRLESEHRQLQVTRGRVEDTPVVESILPVFHAFLSGTPTGSRFRWDRIDFAPHRIVQAAGLAKSFGDYENVGNSLRKAGFQVPPLSTAQVSGGVSMRLDNVTHRPNLDRVKPSKDDVSTAPPEPTQ